MFRRRADIMAGLLACLARRAVRGAIAFQAHRIVRTAFAGLVALAAGLAVSPVMSQPAKDKPVPPGAHPGGIPVALIGAGIDYTAPEIHPRLARDGEGELTGFDFIDDDRMPYGNPGDTASARIVLSEGQASVLAVVRTDFEDAAIFGPSLVFALKSPARVLALLHPFSGEQFLALVTAAALHAPDKLLIVGAGDGGIDLDSAVPADVLGGGNILVVTAATPEGHLREKANFGKAAVDLAIATPEPNGSSAAPSATAVARVAALAARLVAVEPELSGRGLKARIVDLATQLSDGQASRTRSGWIAEPRRHFWLE